MNSERLTMHTPDGACLILKADNEKNAQQELMQKFKEACNKLAELEDKLENGTLIEIPCKVGDTVYVIPSLTNYRLNVLHGLSENNRVCEQKVHSVTMWKPDEWCLWTCDGVNLLLQQYYKITWFLTREEAQKALLGMTKEALNFGKKKRFEME